MRAIGTVLAVTLLSLGTSSTDAYADVVSPPPTDCPSGSYGATSHGGPYCAPNVCPVSSRQCNPKDCQDAGLCIVEHSVGGRRPPDAAPQFTHEVVGPCDSTGSCSEGTCTTMTVCLTGGAGGGGGSTGRGGATGAGGAARDGGTGGSSALGIGGASAGVNRGGTTDPGAAGGSRGGAAGAGGASAGTGGTSAAQVGGSATSSGGAGGAPVGVTAGSAGTGKAGTTDDVPKVAGCTCRLAAPKSSGQGLGALAVAALLIGLRARRKSRRAEFDSRAGRG